MKLIRSCSILLTLMILLFCSAASAQDLATTRPRLVPDASRQKQSDEDATKLALNGTASGTQSDLKVAVPWVVLTKAEPRGVSRMTRWRPFSTRRVAQDPTPQPTIDEVHEGFTVSGKAPDGKTLKLYVNDVERTDTNPATTVARAGVFTFRLTKDLLKCKEKIQVSYDDGNGNEISSNPTTVVCGLDLTRGNLVGLAPFGVVMSQQAESFSQADPFGGFVIGYMGPQRKRIYCETGPDNVERCTDVKPGQAIQQLDKIRVVPRGSWNVRIQGIFQTAARTAMAPEVPTEPEEPGVSPQQEEEEEPQETFIASRKSFDVDMHLWYEMPLLGSRIFWWGPYAAIGASTVLDENELEGEAVNTDDTPLDTNRATSSNDIDKYYEGGFIFNFYKGEELDTNLYIQAILAYGNYEALADLRPESNTKHRFVGKLRVFPTGLNRSFFEEGIAAPMFGVDLNAGRGEDHLKFFVGVTFNVSKLIDGLKNKPPTP